MDILESIEKGTVYKDRVASHMEIGVDTLPLFRRDTTDRNRTSPFAFTGNKFEFRMLGSSQSIAGPNIVLNTIVAEELEQFADALEGAGDFKETLNGLIRKTISEHKRIISTATVTRMPGSRRRRAAAFPTTGRPPTPCRTMSTRRISRSLPSIRCSRRLRCARAARYILRTTAR